ncbi:prepilin-type N-terminal cleavage/methylation domain-containing protein [Candidatus Binatia bacterium]|nr:prepilin-type N-terminal cleavage/methylation domain-containing protein [Candidatus Binatia bacterium]
MRRLACQRGFTAVELLIASLVGTLVLAAGVALLRVHVGVARTLQVRLAALGGTAWALTVASRDVATAGGDPRRAGIAALTTAAADRIVLAADRDGNGAVDPASAERVTLAWSSTSGGRLVRWLGNQSIAIAATVRSSGVGWRYYDADGSEITGTGGVLAPADAARVRLVRTGLEATERSGTIAATTTLRSAAALRTRLEGR